MPEKWQYGVVIDAGSSGSRAHIYRWLKADEARKTDDRRKYESLPVLTTKKSWAKKIKPGVSTFAHKPHDVGPDHLQDLIDHALEHVPSRQVAETPIFLLATAGMRLLPDDERSNLLSEICTYIGRNSDFLLPDCDLHIQVIPGSTEGLYGWIATNYLLGGFDAKEDHDHGKGHHTYGFLDMGGASSQIAFAPNSTEAEKHANDLQLLRLRRVNGAVDEYGVFVTTWLGFGVNQARERYIDALLTADDGEGNELPDPCLPKGLLTSTEGDILESDGFSKTRALIGTGEIERCLDGSLPLLGKDKPCDDEPCLLDGVHVPAIDFDVNHFVGVSEYWHTTHGIFDMGHGGQSYDFAAYKKLVGEFCSQDWKDIQKGLDKKKFGKGVDEKDAAEVCFKASWIINMLHTGIGVPIGDANPRINDTSEVPQSAKDRGFLNPFQSINKIDDTEVSWTLGKMLLYASSEVPPGKTSNAPVGFGSNMADGIPADWQYPGGSSIRLPPSPNSTYTEDDADDSDSWRDTLFQGNTPRRVPGFLLFLVIIIIATFLLCGKDRRARFFRQARCCSRGGRYGRRRGGMLGPKLAVNGQDERLLESGMLDPDDFELGPMEEETYSDDAVAGKTSHASGWETPRMRTPVAEGFGETSTHVASAGFGGVTGLGINAMQSSGLLPRTESRERLHGVEDRGRRSRRASPTRLRSPLISA